MAKAENYRTRFQDKTKAQKYATRFERGSRKRIDRREQRAVAEAFSRLDGCRNVLDVPSGAGRFLGVLGQANRQVIEIDVSHEMVEFARSRAAKLGVRSHGVQADALRLPLADGVVDCVFCNRLLHHIMSPTERAAFLREFHRVSRRYLVISFFDYHSFGGVRRFLKALKGRKPPYEGQPTREQFQREAEQSGFQVRAEIPTGPAWVAEKYLVMEKITR